MKKSEIDRRDFLQIISGGLVSGGLAATVISSGFMPLTANASTLQKGRLYASSRQNQAGQQEAVIFSPLKGDLRVVPLPGRAHDVTAHPFKTEVVAVARRPGRFLMVFSADRTKQPLQLSAKAGRHFQGHGVFSKDGTLFFSAENDYEGERGVIGVRDVTKGYQQVAEYPSYGIGIHELDLHPDGKTLVVANGGILTHPDTGRAKLNLATMTPSLAYIDSQNGKLMEQQFLPPALHKLSIRHFAIAPNGTLVFGCQFQGVKHKYPPLVGIHKGGERPILLKAEKKIQHQMQNYIGSVAIDVSGKIAATSAPRGNLVSFWNLDTGTFLHATSFPDGCGLAPTNQPGHFVMSNGQGRVVDYDVLKQQTLSSYYQAASLHWDNHMLAL